MGDSLHVVCPGCSSTNRVPEGRLSGGPICGVCHNPLFLGRPAELNQANFQKHISNSQIPLLVDFWASWCGPCKMMAPIFAETAVELEPYCRLIKINSETEQGLASQFSIRSIPTLLLFKNAQEIARSSGVMDKNQLVAWVRSHL